MEDLLTTKRHAWFSLCICRYAYKAKKSCEPLEKQNAHLFENAPPKGEHFFFASCHTNNGMECMSCPLWPSIAPPNFLFFSSKNLCKIVQFFRTYGLHNPHFYFLKHSSRPDLTSHYTTPKVKLSGWGLARSFIFTPVGLNPESFEFSESQTGAIPPSQSPLRPEYPFCLDKHFNCCVDISLLK